MKVTLSKTVHSIILTAAGLAVFLINITFRPHMPVALFRVLQLAIIIVLALLHLKLRGKGRDRYRDVIFSFLAASVALTAVSFFRVQSLGISVDSPSGIALAKLFDSAIIVAVLIISFKAAKYDLGSIYIRRGRLLPGLIIGLVTFAAMALMVTAWPGNEDSAGIIYAYLPWILVFIFSNAFMEELLFRGIFLKRMNALIGAPAAILVTSLVFALAHMQVTYQSPSEVAGFVVVVFLLALIWGTAMHSTGSILASTLFHAGADLVIIVEIYNSLGALG